ncbi:hypothetical protein DAPPUDRAFT_346996 [Daphnia pulex]|uniref:Circadian locomoter output cycles protein kaput n=1 Tax=Daphnia pulex TaxID=6669 RepID=E9GKD1_DAPPU|nr:hypothetical protein DAPPUDRAFT_346996 [Daphnia pulex]|eukprot:EFX79971.1 hypothetical protein DAPPUDRAFT_346996 [Daphnia pulex]
MIVNMSVKSQPCGLTSSKLKKATASKISDDGLEDEVDEKGVIKRKSRNLSEKKRRDQFNILINELCSMVCTGKRKMDKSTILKSAISFIRNHNQVTMQSHCQESVQEDWKPSFLSNEEFTHLMLEALDEFIIVFSSTGKILYVSENITCLLGHTPSDLIGSSLSDLVWEEERIVVESLLGSWGADHESSQVTGNKENHISLSCHLRRGNLSDANFESSNYELVFFSGYYRVQGNPDISSVSRVSSSWGDDSKESTNFGDALSQYNGLVFVASARLQTPQLSVEMSIVDVSKSEFTSRHSLEWKFLFLDHRGPPIIGYLPFEVLGTSGYDYYHVDDLEKVSTCHEALMQKGEVTSCCYRFLTKGQQWIWLQTKYYITYHQWYSKPEFIVCSHRVISYNEVTGHPLKIESEESCDQVPGTPNTPTSKQLKSEYKSGLSHGKNAKTDDRNVLQDDSNRNQKRNMITNQSNRDRMKNNKQNYHHNVRQHQPNSSMSDAQPPESPSGESVMLRPPPLPTTESMPQHSRHPSGSSRVGTALSDTGSISSSGSFQSAASMQSDQSMHSIHSHNSMQSVHGQQTQQATPTFRSSNQSCSVHSCVNTNHQHQNKQPQPQFVNQNSFTSANNMQMRNTGQLVHTQSRFLQPRVNSGSSVRRTFLSGTSPTPVPTSNSASSSGASFTYQSVSIGMEGSGVALPVQRIIEGLPVVTLPGIVAHEPIIMTAGQREFHERLRIKHLEIQKSILAQQEELRRVETELLLAQYGAWGPTVLKMTVPYAETDGTASATQPTVLSTGGLVTCLTTENSISLGQPSSSQVGNSSAGSMTFSPGTPILVQSPPELHTRSPERDFLSHEIQILLAQSLLQDNPTSIEYLP